MFIKDLKKIAFIKYGGLASGGTEVNFQTIAKHLSKNYQVDYYYCDPSRYIGSDFVHPPTDKSREEYLRDSNVNLIKFNVEYKDVTDRNHKWINTDFWDLFNRNRNKYSLILTTTAGPHRVSLYQNSGYSYGKYSYPRSRCKQSGKYN